MSEEVRILLTAVTFLLLGASCSFIAFMALVDKLKARIKQLEKNKFEFSDEEIEGKAFWWSVDYKPFNYDLDYTEYAKYGFEKGFKECLRLIKTNQKAQYNKGVTAHELKNNRNETKKH